MNATNNTDAATMAMYTKQAKRLAKKYGCTDGLAIYFSQYGRTDITTAAAMGL